MIGLFISLTGVDAKKVGGVIRRSVLRYYDTFQCILEVICMKLLAHFG